MSWVADIRGDVFNFVSNLTEVATLTDTNLVESQLPTEIERQELASREISVFVDSAETVLASRNCKSRRFVVWLTLVEPLKRGQENAQAEANQLVIDAIEAALLGARLGGTRNALCTAVEQLAVLSPKHWYEFRQYASYVKLTVEV